jgi:hypothetical protein
MNRLKIILIFFSIQTNLLLNLANSKPYKPSLCEATSRHLSNGSEWAKYNSTNFKTKSQTGFDRIQDLFSQIIDSSQNPIVQEHAHRFRLARREMIRSELFKQASNLTKNQMRTKLMLEHMNTIYSDLVRDFSDNPRQGIYTDHYRLMGPWRDSLQNKYAQYLSAAKILSPALCLAEFGSSGCGIALPRILDHISPYITSSGRSHISMVSETISIWSSGRYEIEILFLAQLMAQKLYSAIEGQAVQGSFITNIINTFRVSGKSMDDAWELIGNLAANWANHKNMPIFEYPSISHLKGAYYLIAEMAFTLDAYTWRDQARLYSLPEIMSTTCHWGKTYHVWMSAYLAYKQRKEGRSKRGSIYASYLSGLMYEMMSPSNGRGLNKIFEEDTFSLHNNSLRLNLGFKAAAAVYGAELASGYGVVRAINIDEVLNQLFTYSQQTDFRMDDSSTDGSGAVYRRDIEQLAMKYQQAKKLPRAFFEFKKKFGLQPSILKR